MSKKIIQIETANEPIRKKEFALGRRIVALSAATTWDEARQEWDITGIDDDEEQTCLCGHNPIYQVCTLTNRLNGNTAIVGNCCVKKFECISSDSMFRSIKRVKKDIEKSLHPDVIELAREKGWINSWMRVFYIDTWRKHSGLSPKQREWRICINKTILERMKTYRLEEAA